MKFSSIYDLFFSEISRDRKKNDFSVSFGEKENFSFLSAFFFAEKTFSVFFTLRKGKKLDSLLELRARLTSLCLFYPNGWSTKPRNLLIVFFRVNFSLYDKINKVSSRENVIDSGSQKESLKRQSVSPNQTTQRPAELFANLSLKTGKRSSWLFSCRIDNFLDERC